MNKETIGRILSVLAVITLVIGLVVNVITNDPWIWVPCAIAIVFIFIIGGRLIKSKEPSVNKR